ncbi:MAG: hypothetical protein IPG51_17535 [Chloroflexi bacterium]|nr:hypothetical protein [Chloroflexota bacterium]
METPTGEAAVEIAVDPRFGVVESFWEPAEAADLQVGWDRILLWHEIQPQPTDDWNTLHVLEEMAGGCADERPYRGRFAQKHRRRGPPMANCMPARRAGFHQPIDVPGNLWAVVCAAWLNIMGRGAWHYWIVWNEPDILADVYGTSLAAQWKIITDWCRWRIW